MKSIIYIFILFIIAILVRSSYIEIKEYYSSGDDEGCQPMDGRNIHEYIQKTMKDHNRDEKNNSLNKYMFGAQAKHYELKKVSGKYTPHRQQQLDPSLAASLPLRGPASAYQRA